MSRLRPTPELARVIASYIRAGGFPHVAAEAAGMPRETFDEWMRRGSQPNGGTLHRGFVTVVRQAIAQARLTAEIAALKDRPLDWLRNGPGKETADVPGWSGVVKAPAVTPAGLDEGELQKLIADLLDVLGPYPDARAAVAVALTKAPACANW
jgi:hypothetical protein